MNHTNGLNGDPNNGERGIRGFTSSLFTVTAIIDRGKKINMYRAQLEEDLDTIIANTSIGEREEIWNYALVVDEVQSKCELVFNRIRLDAYFDYAIVMLDEVHSEQCQEFPHQEYVILLDKMRYTSLVIDAIVNSSQGGGQSA